MHRADFHRPANAVEYPFPLFGFPFDVQLNLDYISIGVRDHHPQRVGHTRRRISAENTDLCIIDTEAPLPSAETVEEASKRSLNIIRLRGEHRREVDEDVVEITPRWF